MTDTGIQSRLDDLEMRYAHQQVALEELTLDRLAQARRMDQLENRVERLERALRAIEANAPGSASGGDERPPHY